MEIRIPDSGVFRISASAGSGKTYSLTRLFIRRMLRERNAFRGMLAITFTNKAANELRERILKRLHELSRPEIPAEEEDFFGFEDREKLASRASEVLEAVLHQSDFLQVGTIDSFFQHVFSTLAVELGLPPGLRTELNVKNIKAELLGEALLRRDSDSIRILVENLSRQLQEYGKDWRTIPYLQKTVLETVFDEPVVSLFLNGQTGVLAEEDLKEAAETLKNYINAIRQEVMESAGNVVRKLLEFGVSPDLLDPELEKSFLRELEKLWEASLGISIPNPVASHSQKGAFHYKMKSRPFSNLELEQLRPLLLRYGEARTTGILANLALAENLLGNLISVRLLVFFRQILQDLNKNQNRFLLSEIKYLLAGFLEITEVPYLFEKTGSSLHTLLIDEFQDTDKTQWKVLKALASVVIDNGGLFAVVGDVKQSIYGWRGADSSLFKSGLDRDLHPAFILEESLGWNFRSDDHIVAFNNWLFRSLADDYAAHLLDCGQVKSIVNWQDTIQKNYQDVFQKAAAAKENPRRGFVKVRVRQKVKQSSDSSEDGEGDEEDASEPLQWLPSEIMQLQDAGFRASDIAILVRTNADAAETIRILDQAKRAGKLGYDFSFSTAANGKASGQAIFVFLILALRHGSGKKLLPFELEQMRCLGTEIGIGEFFTSEFWAQDWAYTQFRQQDLEGIFQEQAMYFGLDKVASQQMMLVQFQDLLNSYLREESGKYPDFFLWWEEKSGQVEVPLGSGLSGITVMTIHRSKGLDFGVVILPVFSSGKGDSKALHDSSFWAIGKDEPWNCHPLLRAKTSKGVLESDLGELYQEDVFGRAVEALNTFYVACTRPRYGLILDITLDGKLDNPDKAAYRIPVKTALLLKGNLLPFDSKDYHLEFDNNGLLVRFQLGEIKAPDVIARKSATRFPDSDGGLAVRLGLQTLKPKNEESNIGQRIGILVHRVLEKTNQEEEWIKILSEVQKSGQWTEDEIFQAENELKVLFAIPEMKDWFSDSWQSFPEQDLISPEGKLLRADRILIKADKAVILDYKTGEFSESHISQLQEYVHVFSEASGMETQAWLLNSKDKVVTSV